ncbi:hypothetical protein B0H13DRAFT_2302351 [Mycena leptocephala]|nr:hypothetical protein B0H13DRAFT_2302351 [Mycena leptocephala]
MTATRRLCVSPLENSVQTCTLDFTEGPTAGCTLFSGGLTHWRWPRAPRASGMARTTRSGAQFSPYELDGLTFCGRQFEVVQTNVSLDALFQQSVSAADKREAALDTKAAKEDEWEDVIEDGNLVDVGPLAFGSSNVIELDDLVDLAPLASRSPSPVSPLTTPPTSPSPSPPHSLHPASRPPTPPHPAVTEIPQFF